MPEQMLSDELLSTIFALSASSLTTSLRDQRASLMLVSRHFRSVVCSTTFFWTNISSSTPLALFPLYLERSKACGIALEINVDLDVGSTSTIVQKLEAVGPRLAYLTATGSPVHLASALQHCQSWAPHLQSLILLKGGEADVTTHQPPQVLPHALLRSASILRELMVSDGFGLGHRFCVASSLETLVIGNVHKLNSLCHALAVTPRLRHLSFKSNNAVPPTSLKCVSLPALEDLEVSVISGGSAEKLLCALTIPVPTRLSIVIQVTSAGLSMLDNDVQAAISHVKRPLSGPIVSLTANADSRYFQRDAVKVHCYAYLRSPQGEHGMKVAPAQPLLSIHLDWNHPWPLQREEAFTRIMQAIPTSHVTELALCTTGPPSHRDGQEFYHEHGVTKVMDYLPHVTTVAVSSRALHEIISFPIFSQLHQLSRIIATVDQWRSLDASCPGFLPNLFEERRGNGLTDVDIELREGEEVFVGPVVERRVSSSYKKTVL
ncbi:hypothetical protein PENSPDRAFT_754523 [Peniophora sp. CONT]|nr:hypothetical protein PENSPDRAFT_760369 [Peniophora sp. CONT]KZV67903.1 hypothetical protein PENSPDRAFT_754523 [Peniophora sp. CONT]